MLSLLLAASLLTTRSLAAIIYDPTLVGNKTYDFIIAGSGPTGSALASRLSEVRGFTVLLIEAGDSDTSNPAIAKPQLLGTLWPNTNVTWNYTTVPTRYVKNRVLQYPRGRALGGSTDINVLLQNKGTPEFWDQFAATSGDPGWSYSNMKNTYLKKYETWNHPKDGTSDVGQYNPAVHGTSGPVQITTSNYHYDTARRIIGAAGEIKGFEFNEETNDDNMLGLSWIQANQGGGSRSEAAAAYLHANGVADRPNLDILLTTTVTKVLFKPTSGHLTSKVASGVTIQKSSGAPHYAVYARKEVILAAGAVNTPMILMLSGIGPASTLSKYGIPVIIDNANVGQNLVDHPRVSLTWQVNDTGTFDDEFRDPAIFNQALAQWEASRSGPLSQTICSTWVWSRVPLDGHPDPSPGGKSPHYETVLCDGFVGLTPATGYYMNSIIVLISPESRGSITISSVDPFQRPLIDTQFLSTKWDVQTVATGFKKTKEFFLNSPSLKNFTIGLYGPAADVKTDAEIEDYIRSNIDTLWHPTCTAKMTKSSTSTAEGVVDPTFRVIGTSNLRVIDNSIFPHITAGHPMGVLYAVSERAADLIKHHYS